MTGSERIPGRSRPPPETPEALCVRFADRIAYLTHDALDALRAGVLAEADFPPHLIERLGQPGRLWIGELITAVIDESLRSGTVRMDAETLGLMHELRDFMFDRVYLRPEQVDPSRSPSASCAASWTTTSRTPTRSRPPTATRDAELVTQVADYVSGMTDRYAQAVADRLGIGSSG